MVDRYDELHILLKIMKRNSTSMVDIEDKYHYINRCGYIYIRISHLYMVNMVDLDIEK